ncbi:MAG: cysteine desulfurase/selenocysteine lyase [Motiliproteus sp.]|jgi:cysteine desulfurase/selenocysteine lyase
MPTSIATQPLRVEPLRVEQLRSDFPLIAQSPDCYLDNAATTQKPGCVLEVMDRYYRQHNANVHRAAHHLSRQATDAFEAARQSVQGFLNAAHADEIIWTRGTTEGINLVAYSFGQLAIGPGDEIITTMLEHHANIVPWQLLAQRSGATLRVVPLTDQGDLDQHAYRALLNPRTKLVALSQVSNALGTVNPIAEMIQQAHAVGAKVLIDGAQAVSHFKIDVQALDCDFYLFSGHKLYGPTGIGVLYGKRQLLQAMPPWQAGGEMIERVSFQSCTFQPPPFRFEAGTPNIVGAIGLAEAIRYLNSFDLDQRQRHEQQLLAHAVQRLSALPGLRIIGQPRQRVGLLPFVIDDTHSLDLGTLLDQHGIALRTGQHCAQPLHQHLGLEGTVRASFGLYNTIGEIDRLANTLSILLEQPDRARESGTQGNSPLTPSTPLTPLAPLTPLSLRQQLLQLEHWQARYSLLMKAAQTQPRLELRQDSLLLSGCSSRVWLDYRYDLTANRLYYQLDSDARIIKGIGMLLLELFDGARPQQVLDQDLHPLLQELGLEKHLSASRNNGLRAIIEAMQAIARRYC